MNDEDLKAIAQVAAWKDRSQHEYIRTAGDPARFHPHNWVLDAMARAVDAGTRDLRAQLATAIAERDAADAYANDRREALLNADRVIADLTVERDAAVGSITGVIGALDAYEKAKPFFNVDDSDFTARSCVEAVETWVVPFTKPAFVGTVEELAEHLRALDGKEGA